MYIKLYLIFLRFDQAFSKNLIKIAEQRFGRRIELHNRCHQRSTEKLSSLVSSRSIVQKSFL